MAEWFSEDEFDEVPEGFEEIGMEEEFASEALYTYHTALDERVCGRCAPLEGVMFSLDEINEQFPTNENFEDIIFVNLHDRCRCQLMRQPTPEEPSEGGEEEMDGRGAPLGRRFFYRPVRKFATSGFSPKTLFRGGSLEQIIERIVERILTVKLLQGVILSTLGVALLDVFLTAAPVYLLLVKPMMDLEAKQRKLEEEQKRIWELAERDIEAKRIVLRSDLPE